MLMIRELVAGYHACEALHGVSLAVGDDSIAAVVGPSGAGKSALANAIAGLVPVSSGQVLLNGEDISHLPVRERAARGLCSVPTDARLFAELTLAENLGIGAGATPGTAEFALFAFPELRPWMPRPAAEMPHVLQRFALVARALGSSASLVMLDQPSRGLDGAHIQKLYRAIARAHRETGISVLLIEQSLFQAVKLADTVFTLEKGRIMGEQSGLELLAGPAVQADFLRRVARNESAGARRES